MNLKLLVHSREDNPLFIYPQYTVWYIVQQKGEGIRQLSSLRHFEHYFLLVYFAGSRLTALNGHCIVFQRWYYAIIYAHMFSRCFFHLSVSQLGLSAFKYQCEYESIQSILFNLSVQQSTSFIKITFYYFSKAFQFRVVHFLCSTPYIYAFRCVCKSHFNAT